MWELLARINQTQKTRNFKVSATLFWLMAIVASYLVLLQSWSVHTDEQHLAEHAQGLWDDENFGALTQLLHTPGLEFEAAVVLTVLMGGVIALTWLGVGVTVLGLAALALGVGFPLTFYESTAGVGSFVLGFAPLSLLFVCLLEVARLALALPSRTFAVARNVLIEAVRLKIALVFIVALIFFLALLPQALGEDQPLRYRVQQWLQWGTGISYLLAMLLTIFFSCATVAFEQRDRVIWQTMSKPVRAWQYVLGKWVGVMVLNLVLLTVMSAGTFMFTEYLRAQPAVGERSAFVRLDGRDTRTDATIQTEDRRILENQVLVAREGVVPDNFDLGTPERQEEIAGIVNRELERIQNERPDVAITPELRARLREEVTTRFSQEIRAIPRGFSAPEEFVFSGLDDIPEDVDEITLRFQIDAGSNDPSAVFRIAFGINGFLVPVNAGEMPTQPIHAMRPVALGTPQTLSLQRNAVVREDGTMALRIWGSPANDRVAVIPPDGLELLAVRGGYSLNFARVMAVMWVKLGFVAAVGVLASCFLSFAVSCLTTLVAWFAAESAAFLFRSLDWFATTRHTGEVIWLNQVAAWLAQPISWSLRGFSELRPTASLADGRLLSWLDLGSAVLTIGLWTVVVLAGAVMVFRGRELALYSGK